MFISHLDILFEKCLFKILPFVYCNLGLFIIDWMYFPYVQGKKYLLIVCAGNIFSHSVPWLFSLSMKAPNFDVMVQFINFFLYDQSFIFILFYISRLSQDHKYTLLCYLIVVLLFNVYIRCVFCLHLLFQIQYEVEVRFQWDAYLSIYPSINVRQAQI